ncbi:MAG TPA: chitobiase/beta-hexosaminidase C-terminal domain-containing protein [Thermoleophilaceae bacterium]|nr:chitobiase/beta-hexosaminidase C-terminal domain-containing protein [Thermoleophilaceae bacterium]
MKRLAVAFVVVLATLGATVADGFWMAGTTVGSAGQAQADTLPTGNTPTVSAVGTNVTVRWTPNTFSGASLSYKLTRYPSGSVGGAGIVLACTGLPVGGGQLSCSDSPAPAGAWQYTIMPTLNNWTGGESAGSAAVTVYNDSTAPTTTATPAPAVPASGWYRSVPVSVTLSATDNAGGSGVAQTTYTLDGSDPQTSATAILYAGPISVSSTTTIKYFSHDNANNVESVKTFAVKVDTAAPANALSLNVASGGAYLSGTSIYYRGAAAGSFTLTNAVSDPAGSGPASSAFPALAGTTTGWSHTAGTVTTPSGGPYVSSAFSWTAGTSSAPTETVTAADVVGNTASTGALTLRNDNTAPTTSGAQSPAVPASGWNAGPVTVTLTSSDAAGSGVGTIKYTTDGSDPTTSPTALTYSGAFTQSSSATIRFAAVDNVGNTETVKTLSTQIDTTAPTPAFSLGHQSGASYLSGTTVFYNGTAAGGFRLTNSVTDADSGAASSATSALTGTTTGWTAPNPTTDTKPNGGPYVTKDFSWVAGTTSSPVETVTTADNAGNTTVTALTFVNDSTPPTSAPSFPTGASYGSGAAWQAGCGTPAVADICGTADDAGSGVTTLSVSIRRASNNTCWTGAAWGACGTPLTPMLTAGANPAWTIALPCTVDSYTVSVLSTDNVGNAITAPGTQQTATITSCA